MPPPLIDDPFEIVDNAPPIYHSKRSPAIHQYRYAESETTWHVHIQGTCAHIYRKESKPEPVAPPKRNPVTVFTEQSRMRLFRYLNRLDWTNITHSVFITVTYPDDVPCLRYKDRNTHRTRFWRYLENYYGCKVPSVWRCEWKPRLSGTFAGKIRPHLHMIAFGVRNLSNVRLRHLWSKSLMHKGYCNVDAALVVGNQGALKYLAKYVSKEMSLGICTYLDSEIQIGRHWGVMRRSLLPLAPVVCDRELTDEEVGSMQAIFMGLKEWYDPVIHGGFTLLGNDVTNEAKNNLGKTC